MTRAPAPAAAARPRRWAAAVAAHPRHVVLAAAVAGLAVGPRLPGVVLWLAAPALLVAVCAVASAGRAGPPIALPLAIAALALPLAAWAAQARLAALDRTELGPLIGHAARVTATVLQPPRPRSFGASVALVGLEGGERAALRVRGPLRARVGEEMRVRGGWRALPPPERALRRSGAHALIAADEVVLTGRRRGGVLGAVDRVRARAEAALGQGLSPTLAALARGMVLGQDEGLDPRTAEDFRASGLAHLVAASGANVALLAALAMALGALLGIAWRARLVLALVLVAGYVPLAGGGASIQRAGIMGAASLVAALASRAASRFYALLLAAAATLALNPRALEDPGWQLSFAAVMALLALALPLRAALARRLPRAVAEAAAVSLAASLATAPLIALHFGRLSWVTLPANLVAVPAVAPIMWLGAAAAAAGQVAPAVAVPFTALAAWPLAFVAWVARAAAGLPGANAAVALAPEGAVAWGALLALAAIGPLRRRAGRAMRRRCRGRRVRGAVAAVVAAGVTVAAIVLWPVAAAPTPGLSVAALDVGQGDATLIRDGARTVLVDAGPPEGPVLDRLAEQGVDRLDLLVVTHAQADHQGGAAAVLRELPVAMVLDGRDGVPSAAGDAWAAAARERGVRVVPAAAGQRVRSGPIVLDVLSPPAAPAGSRPAPAGNERAIVARLRDGGFSMLLPADVESDVLLGLPLTPVDVLKVAHHGSADPGLPALLARLRPRTALIEVGRRNPYGHPTAQALRALRAVVPVIRRTDRDGTVLLRP